MAEEVIRLAIDASQLLRDSKAALDELAHYSARKARQAAVPEGERRGFRTGIRREVAPIIKEAEGRATTAQQRAEIEAFKKQYAERIRRGAPSQGEIPDPDVAGMNRASAQRLSALKKTVKKEQDLARHVGVLAETNAQAATLAERRIAIEKQVLARARLGLKTGPTQREAISQMSTTALRGQTRADEGLSKAREQEAYRVANLQNEAELAKLSARERLTKERQTRLQQQAYQQLQTRSVLEQNATHAANQERATLERRLRLATVMLGEDQQQLQIEQSTTRLKAQTALAEQRLATATNRAQAEMMKEQGLRRGTRFQRFQAAGATRAGGGYVDPESQQRLGQFVKTRAISSAGFALSGVGIYGAIAAMRQLITESSELEVQFSLIESQWNRIGTDGMTGAISSFRDLKKEILDVSLATASAADETASIVRQLAGAFSVEGRPDFERAVREAEVALKIARTTGLPNQEITDSLTATTIAFAEQGVTFEQIGDLLVGLESKYGVLGTELIQFTADLAPLGAELGFTAEQLTALGAVAQQSSGRSGTVIAEQLGRIIPSLHDQSAALLELFSNNTATAASVAELAQAFEAGDLPGVLSLIAGNFDQFTDAQRNALASMVGGRREAAVLFSILTDGAKTVDALNNTNFEDFGGDLEDRFGEISSNVQFKLDELRRSFEEFGLALFEAGLADAIIAIASAFSLFFQAVNPVLGLLTDFNDLLGGIPLQLLLIAGGLKAIAAISKTSGRTGGLFTGIGLRGMYAGDAIRGATPGGIARGAGRFAGTAGRTVVGGGSLIGKGVQVPGGVAGLVRSLAPALLAFEAINSFMANVQEQAAEVARVSEEARTALDSARTEGGAAQEMTREQIQRQMDEARQEQGGYFGGGAIPFLGDFGPEGSLPSRAVNYIGGRAMNLLGGDGDAALRSAAGEDQDWEVLEQELYRDKAEEYRDTIETVLLNSDEAFIEALKNANLQVIADTINANKGYKTDVVKDFIGEDNTISASDFSEENIKALQDAAAEGDVLAAEIVRLLGEFATTEEAAAALGEALELGELGGIGDELPKLDKLKSALERGEITTAEFVRQANRIGDTWREIAYATGSASDQTQQALDEAANAYAEAAAAANEIFQSDIDAEDFLTSITNPDQGPADRAKALADRLKQGRAAGVGYADLDEIARELIEAEQQALQERVDATEDVAEQLRLIENATFSDEARSAIALVNLNSGRAGDAIRTTANAMGVTTDEVTDTIVDKYNEFGQGAVKTLEDIIEAEYQMDLAAIAAQFSIDMRAIDMEAAGPGRDLTAQAAAHRRRIEAQAEARARRDAAIGALREGGSALDSAFDIPGGPGATVPDEDSEDARKKALEEELSFLDVAAARAGDDAVALARIAQQKAAVNAEYAVGTTEKNNALAEIINADRALREALADQGMQTELALLNIAAARAGDDAVALAGIARQKAAVAGKYATTDVERLNAQAEMINADNALREAQNQRAQENATSALDVAAARAGGDAVELARIAKQRAQISQRFASTTAEKNNAIAELINADREMAESIFALFESSSAILIAQADAAMNTVASAQEQLRVLRERMSRADQLGLGPADRNNLQAEIIGAQAALRDATLAEERGMIDYQLAIGEITQGQAISALQSLLAIPGLADEQIRELNLEIKRMTDQLGSDYQYNLPTQLAIPTAYEARRFDQGGASMAGGYNDNRNITVSVQVATDASPEQIANAVTSAIGDPNRNGTVVKKY